MVSANHQAKLLTESASKFTLFPDLPKELQDVIWKLALPKPRVLSVTRYNPHTNPRTNFYLQHGVSQFDYIIDVNPVPTLLLHTSQEARAATLRQYQPAFNGILRAGPTYFDFERDSILFTNWSTLRTFCGDRGLAYAPLPASVEAWKSKIRNVGVQGGFFEAADQTFFIQCPLLKKLIIETPGGNLGCRQHGVLLETIKIKNRLANAWKERLQTEDETKLPVLDFAFHGRVKLRLEHN
jgi:hypothetical protein